MTTGAGTTSGASTTTTAARWTALAAVAAALSPAVLSAIGVTRTVAGVPGGMTSDHVVAVIGAVAAGVTLVLALLPGRQDRVLAGTAIATLAFVAPTVLTGALSPLGAVCQVLARALLIAVGIVVLRGSSDIARRLGWVVTIAAIIWFAGEMSLYAVVPFTQDQAVLTVLFTLPGVGATVAWLAAALLVLPTLVEPVGRGLQRLWASAEVR